MLRILKVAFVVIIFVFGFVIGQRYTFFDSRSASDRILEVMGLIDRFYVDTINMSEVDDRVIPHILSELDPHSAYLSAELNRAESESLDGSFQGIGVQFNRFHDTVIISRIIPGGGAERAGLQPGDRILRADTSALTSADLSNEAVMSRLKGPAGTVVRLAIYRGGKTLEAAVVRGPVPMSSVDAAYRLPGDVLYIRLNKWGGQTHQEFLTEYMKHSKPELKGMILDLRDNGGGYLDAAVDLAGEFLPEGADIVYMEGRAMPRESYTTERNGLLVDMPLVVLVNEFSASSSEIFAGAMQDHDRARIVGRRTFGKGLVQRPFVLSDSSVVRLTVARYYTPSGRSIQKSYAAGADAYERDLSDRYEHGELYSADSIAQADTVKYYTAGRRVVHGGGGITPDLFVPRDSTGINSYYLRLIQSGSLPRFAFDYADKHRARLSAHPSLASLLKDLRAQGSALLYEYAYYAQAQGVSIRTTLLRRSSTLLLSQLYALIADNVMQDLGAYYEVINEQSEEVNIARQLLSSGQWRPRLGETVTVRPRVQPVEEESLEYVMEVE